MSVKGQLFTSKLSDSFRHNPVVLPEVRNGLICACCACSRRTVQYIHELLLISTHFSLCEMVGGRMSWSTIFALCFLCLLHSHSALMFSMGNGHQVLPVNYQIGNYQFRALAVVE